MLSDFVITAVLIAIFITILETRGPHTLLTLVSRHLTPFCHGPPFLEWSTVPSILALHRSFDQIKSECLELCSDINAVPNISQIDPTQSNISKGWRATMLFIHGRPVTENLVRCPATHEALRQVQGMWTAFYSILEPGASIPAHTGFTKGLLCYHLGIKVPRHAKKCYMVSNGIRHVWKENQGVLFDDTYQHYMINTSSELRIVLCVHIMRPLKRSIGALNRLCLGLVARNHLVTEALKVSVIP